MLEGGRERCERRCKDIKTRIRESLRCSVAQESPGVGEDYVEFEFGPSRSPVRFEDPLARVTAWDEADVPTALEALCAAQSEGSWLAGYASYELGYALEARLAPLMPEVRRLPLLDFGVFPHGPAPVRRVAPDGMLSSFRPRWDAERYRGAFARVADYIQAGDVYQVNLTLPLDGCWQGNPAAIAASLATRQPVGFGAHVALGDAVLLSRSPELFFALDGRGGIETRPMKGTAPRHPEKVRDADLAASLAVDPKNLAENLMIVDLLRNDIARIAKIGSVRVPGLFEVETFTTVHQMVSRVGGQLREGIGLSQIFTALFPCGSVTGAPKIRAMEIIRDLEPWPREAYCGAIGWAAPDGRAVFNVAIRTLVLFPEGMAILNVGGGVVADSTAESEYEEAL